MRTYSSFADLGKMFGVKDKKPAEEKTLKCRVCGGRMHQIGGTNVWACRNIVTRKKKDGTEVTEVCGNTLMKEVAGSNYL